MTPQAGDVRFEVAFCPKAHGDKIRAEDDGDWPGDHCLHRQFPDFRQAEQFAIEKAQDDWFGVTQLRRFVCENPKYDWWDQTGVWEVDPDIEPGTLDPDSPID